MMNDVIKPSNSPYNLLVWVVSKKPDAQGTYNMENSDRFSHIKRKNDRKRIFSSQYYGDIGSARKLLRKIF